jgi:hypothetical protein
MGGKIASENMISLQIPCKAGKSVETGSLQTAHTTIPRYL